MKWYRSLNAIAIFKCYCYYKTQTKDRAIGKLEAPGNKRNPHWEGKREWWRKIMGLTHNLCMDPSQGKQWSHLTLIDLHCSLTSPHWIDEDKETLGPCNTWRRRKGKVTDCRMRSKSSIWILSVANQYLKSA